MKQHITIEQLNELTPKSKEKLKDWWNPKDGDLFTIADFPNDISVWDKSWEDRIITGTFNPPILSIGQMIELIQDNIGTDWSIYFGMNLAFVGREDKDGFWGQTPENKDGELCDGLWELVKEILK